MIFMSLVSRLLIAIAVFCQQISSFTNVNKISLNSLTHNKNSINDKVLKSNDLSSRKIITTNLPIPILATVSFGITYSYNLLAVHASPTPATEAVQLLYGHQTNIPYSITWVILLYGIYKMWLELFKWLATW